MINVYAQYADEQLAALLKQGDRMAFTQIYERFHGLLYVHAYKRLRDSSEAEDAVHDLFAKLWLNHEKLDVKTNFAGYLYASVRNAVLTTIARRGFADRYLSGNYQDLPENAVTDHKVRESQLREIIERHVASLPAKMREVFELSRKAQLSHREIAEQLGISEKTVKSQINSALKVLRDKLGAGAFIWLLMNY